MLSRGQKCVTTHSLEMNTTLFRFRDPVWCIQSQLKELVFLFHRHGKLAGFRTANWDAAPKGLSGVNFKLRYVSC